MAEVEVEEKKYQRINTESIKDKLKNSYRTPTQFVNHLLKLIEEIHKNKDIKIKLHSLTKSKRENKKSRKDTEWVLLIKKVKEENPDLSFGEITKKASQIYKNKQ